MTRALARGGEATNIQQNDVHKIASVAVSTRRPPIGRLSIWPLNVYYIDWVFKADTILLISLGERAAAPRTPAIPLRPRADQSHSPRRAGGRGTRVAGGLGGASARSQIDNKPQRVHLSGHRYGSRPSRTSRKPAITTLLCSAIDIRVLLYRC